MADRVLVLFISKMLNKILQEGREFDHSAIVNEGQIWNWMFLLE
ncbi:MAG: hypothetical protein AB1391_04265 [Candidatus Micrarchaeota archaeon]